MCVRSFGALVFVLLQSLSLSQGVRMETEEQIMDLVERILVEKTAALSDKVHSLEKTVKNQQSRIYHLEKNGRRNERRIKGMETLLTDIRTELKLNSFEAYERNTSIDAGYYRETHADKFGNTEFDNEGSVSVSLEETSRLSKKRVAGISRQRQVPEIVAFSAYLSHNIEHMAKGHIVVFDQVHTNDGSGYNAHTGIFTVPTTGLYLFTYSVNDHHDRAMLQLVVDGNNIVDIIVDPDSYTEETMSGNTAIIHVSQGQSVWIQEYHIDNGSIWSNDIGRYCTFSGVLLY